MNRRFIYIGAAIALYALCLIATLPAGWAYVWAKPRLPATVSFADVSGTVWQGRARVAQWGTLQVEKLHWDLKAWPFLLGRVSTALEFSYHKQPGQLSVVRYEKNKKKKKDNKQQKQKRNFLPLLRLPGTELGGVVAAKLE